MKRVILMLTLICTAFCYTALTESDELGIAADEVVLMVDSGDLNLSGLYSTEAFGLAEAVKLKPPSASWTLKRIQIAGWDFYIENETDPGERIVCLEIRDKDLNVLYKYADSQIAYFNAPWPGVLAEIEIPPLKVSDDFYVCFYDRGAVAVAYEFSESGENSFVFNRFTGEMKPFRILVNDTAEPAPVNWYIRAVGY